MTIPKEIDWLTILKPVKKEVEDTKDTTLSIRVSKADRRMLKLLARRKKISMGKLLLTGPLEEARKRYG